MENNQFLDRNKLGPIARTYDHLHGIDALKEAFYARSNIPIELKFVRTALQSIELILFNLEDLNSRQAQALGVPSKQATDPRRATYASWHCDLLQIALNIASEAHASAKGNMSHSLENPLIWETKGAKSYLASLERLADLEREFAEGRVKQFRTAITTDGITNSLSLLSHRMGTMAHFKEILMLRLSDLWAMELPCSSDEFVRSDALYAAYSEPQLLSEFDTFFNQFRVLHQVPELLAMQCLEELKNLREIEISDIPVVQFYMSRVTILVRLIVDCLSPLVRYMVPHEYYKIRENLGATSGSHSENLAHRVLTKEFADLRRRIRREATSEAHRPLVHNLARLDSMVLLWRDIHLALPRALLGGHGTVSLMGSPDGLDAALKMRNAFASANHHSLMQEPAKCTATALTSFDKLDELFRSLYARHAQTRFRDVQKRTGFFKDYPEKGE